MLQFVNPPDYEKPKDRSGGNTATPDATGTPDEASDNTYSVVIRAIASRTSGDIGPAETVDTTVAVTVTDVDEDGEVVISRLQPEVHDANNEDNTNTVIMATPDRPGRITKPHVGVGSLRNSSG